MSHGDELLIKGDDFADSMATDTDSILQLWNGKGCRRRPHPRKSAVGIGDVARRKGVLESVN